MRYQLFITDWHIARLLKGNNLNICCELFDTIEYFSQADQLEWNLPYPHATFALVGRTHTPLLP